MLSTGSFIQKELAIYWLSHPTGACYLMAHSSNRNLLSPVSFIHAIWTFYILGPSSNPILDSRNSYISYSSWTFGSIKYLSSCHNSSWKLRTRFLLYIFPFYACSTILGTCSPSCSFILETYARWELALFHLNFPANLPSSLLMLNYPGNLFSSLINYPGNLLSSLLNNHGNLLSSLLNSPGSLLSSLLNFPGNLLYDPAEEYYSLNN